MLKTKKIEPEEVIKPLHSRMCQCIAQTLVQQLDNIKEQISGDFFYNDIIVPPRSMMSLYKNGGEDWLGHVRLGPDSLL